MSGSVVMRDAHSRLVYCWLDDVVRHGNCPGVDTGGNDDRIPLLRDIGDSNLMDATSVLDGNL